MRRHSAYTPYIAVVAALILTVLIAFAHQRANSRGQADFLTTSIRGIIIAPGVCIADRLSESFQTLFLTPRKAERLIAENERLKAQTAQLALQNQDLRAQADDAARLRKMFFLPALHPWKRTPAIAISVKPSIQRDTAVLQLAAGASGAPRDVVVDLSGNLVGQVTKTTRGICDLLLVTDMQFSSGAKIVQTGRGQSSKVVIGICEGNRGDTVVLSDMPIDADVRPGDLVETSGLGSVFPAGLPLGTVVSVSADPARSIKSAVVRVNADLNDLHEVYVLQ